MTDAIKRVVAGDYKSLIFEPRTILGMSNISRGGREWLWRCLRASTRQRQRHDGPDGVRCKEVTLQLQDHGQATQRRKRLVAPGQDMSGCRRGTKTLICPHYVSRLRGPVPEAVTEDLGRLVFAAKRDTHATRGAARNQTVQCRDLLAVARDLTGECFVGRTSASAAKRGLMVQEWIRLRTRAKDPSQFLCATTRDHFNFLRFLCLGDLTSSETR